MAGQDVGRFPHIERFSDIYPHIKDYPWLKVARKDGMCSINYCTFTYMEEQRPVGVFPDAWALECRGIKFGESNGRILARPFHKFFNLGEVGGGIEGRDLGEALVMEKLDGSMIYPIIHPLTHEVRLCTKQGITEVSERVEKLVSIDKDVLRDILMAGYTPIMEFTSPHQRIVIPYAYNTLTLLAARNTISGVYCSLPVLRDMARELSIKVVEPYPHPFEIGVVRGWRGKEGVVLAWEDGYRIKVKAEEYVLMHRTKDVINLEKDRVALVLGGNLDDLKGLVDDGTYARLRAYASSLVGCITSFIDRFMGVYEQVKVQGLSKKELVLRVGPSLPPVLKGYVFKQFDRPMDKEAWLEQVTKDVLGRTSSTSRLETIREIIGPDSFT